LQAVDELIDGIIERLEARPDILANTYLIYTNDNGFHISQHGLPLSQSCGIEGDVNIAFFIWGPGVQKNATVGRSSSQTDIVPWSGYH
jgi:arylsulfatase A-like enzyme